MKTKYFLTIIGLLLVILGAVQTFSPVQAADTCPEGEKENGTWYKIDSGDLSEYPVNGATDYCFKASQYTTDSIPDGGFGQDGACEETHIERCDLSHWSYFIPNNPPEPVYGCTDEDALNYNENATVDDGSCEYPPIPGCMDEDALNYNENANVDDGSCEYPPEETPGCMDEAALNYNPDATVDDGSCEYPPIPGCMDENALNYNPDATEDDGSCEYPPEETPGCMDEDALNYNEEATVDDGSCEYPPGEIPGCTDKNAKNYNPNATEDDGSCRYPSNKPPAGAGEWGVNASGLPFILGGFGLLAAALAIGFKRN